MMPPSESAPRPVNKVKGRAMLWLYKGDHQLFSEQLLYVQYPKDIDDIFDAAHKIKAHSGETNTAINQAEEELGLAGKIAITGCSAGLLAYLGFAIYTSATFNDDAYLSSQPNPNTASWPTSLAQQTDIVTESLYSIHAGESVSLQLTIHPSGERSFQSAPLPSPNF